MRTHLSTWVFALLGSIALAGLGCTLNINEPPAEQELPSEFTSFKDPDSDFSAVDINDVDGEIVRFEIATKAIVWATDGTSYQAGFWSAVDPYPEATQYFKVLFGSEGGVQKAYFTETSTTTICDIKILDGDIAIFATDVLVPQN